MATRRSERTEVLTGSYGCRDCDALGKVWAHTVPAFNRMMSRTMREAARDFATGERGDWQYGTPARCMDQLWYVGPFHEAIADIVANMEEPDRESELRNDIATAASGYVY